MRSAALSEGSPEVVIVDVQPHGDPASQDEASVETCASNGLPGTSSSGVAPVVTNLPVLYESLCDETLLRACPMKVLLSNFGAIFTDNKGSAETYSLSEPATGLTWFVSHNWSTARVHKFAILALSFNFYPAVVATALGMIVVLVLTAWGALPLIEESASDDLALRIGVCGQFVSPVIFLGVLFTWQELASSMGLLNTKVFLDKICINQADDDLKREGILSLAAFLGRTDGMLVVYTPTYLQRLWTVFELASLVILYPEKQLKVVPVFFVRIVVFGMLAATLFLAFFQAGRSKLMDFVLMGTEIPVSVGANTLGSLVLAFLALHWARGREEMRSALMSFRMAEAACMEEADRGLVQKSVEIFLKRKHIVEASASRDEALLAFEKMIQQDVARRLLSEIGFQGIPYKYVLAIWIPRFGRAVDLVGAYLYDEVDPGYIAFTAFHQQCINVFVIPVLLAIPSVLMKTCTNLSGWRSIAIVLGVAVTLSLFGFGMSFGLDAINDLALRRSPWGIAGAAAFHGGFALAAWAIYCWLPRRSQR